MFVCRLSQKMARPSLSGKRNIVVTLNTVRSRFYDHDHQRPYPVAASGDSRSLESVPSYLESTTAATRLVRSLIITYALEATAKQIDKESLIMQRKPVEALSRRLGETELSEIEKSFNALDKDGSGCLELDEIQDFLHDMGVNVIINQTRKTLAAIDKDGDGKISKEEFLEWYLNLIHNYSLMPSSDDLFKIFDKNNDGSITVDEFNQTLNAMNMNFTKDEIESLLHTMDRNQSGTIELNEFKSFWKDHSQNCS